MKLIVNRFQGNKNQDDSLWYGGKVANIITDKETFSIVANGEVRCELIAKHDIEIDDYEYKKGEVILKVVDKNNHGIFKYEMGKFIKNDSELYELINGNNPDYELELENNNWLEVFYKHDENGESDVLDCSTIDEAIKEIIEEIKDTIKFENDDIIYCRSAIHDDVAVKNQEEKCKINIINNCKNQLYDLFVDNGFSGLNPYDNPAFSTLLDKANSNSKIYVSNITRISRDGIKMQEISTDLLKKESNIYMALEKENLSDYLKQVGYIILSRNMLDSEEELDHEEMEEIEYE